VGLVVAQPFEALEVLAAGQDVVGEVEDVVGLEVGQVALEQVQLPVDGVGQAEALDEELAGAEAAGVQAAGLVADLVVDVVVAEQAAALLRPLPRAQAPADAALAIAEALAYPGVHLKYLPARGKGERGHTPISPCMPRYFETLASLPGTILSWPRGGRPGFPGALVGGRHGACPGRCGRGCAPGCAPARPSSASCAGVDCRAPPRWRWTAAGGRPGT